MKSKDKEHSENPAGKMPEGEIENLKARLAELEGMRERFLLAAADFENAKKRLTRERDDFVRFSQEKLIRELLPVLDNFERALSHGVGTSQDASAKAVVTGIQMVFKQLEEILKSQGLKRVKTVGEIFDPHQHEAVAYVSSPGKENEITDEVEAGYFLHDRLLRAAKVRVRGSAHASESGEKQDDLT